MRSPEILLRKVITNIGITDGEERTKCHQADGKG